jgi:hypothetical protein
VTRRRRLLIISAVLASTLVASTPAEAGPQVDPYQSYVANQLSWRTSRNPDVWETTCDESDRVEQPGVQAFRDMTLVYLGGSDGAIWTCSRFEHEEGRAWDWMNDAGNPEDVARVSAMLDWLLASDAHGRPQVMARRLGLAYVIWNRQILTLYGSNRTWRPYDCDDNPTPGNCHTNHVHFAFSWAGAREQTSWFTTNPRPADWYPRRDVTGPPS